MRMILGTIQETNSPKSQVLVVAAEPEVVPETIKAKILLAVGLRLLVRPFDEHLT
jgi:hypothetical protein